MVNVPLGWSQKYREFITLILEVSAEFVLLIRVMSVTLCFL